MGDCYDRYLIRVEELRSSLFIIFQCLSFLQNNNDKYLIEDFKIVPPYREHMKYSMESLIHHLSIIRRVLLLIVKKLMYQLRRLKVNLECFWYL